MIRRPAVAGAFYPGSKASLEKELSQLITFTKEKKMVIYYFLTLLAKCDTSLSCFVKKRNIEGINNVH